MGLTLAFNLNATAVTEHAFSRPSFNAKDPTFHPEPLETILDYEAWRGYWEQQGLNIIKSADTSKCVFVDLTSQGRYHLTSGGFSSWPEPKYTLPEALSELVFYINWAVQPILAANPGAVSCVHIGVSNPATVLNLPQSQQYIPQITAEAWLFAPGVLSAANDVLASIAAQNHTSFLGVHLRIETDFVDFLQHGATSMNLIDIYLSIMKSAGFTNSSAVYFASAMFGYYQETVAHLKAKLIESGVAGAMIHKYAVLDPSPLQGFHSEQLALIDFIVLSRAQRFIGDPRSTFSLFLREYRLLQGIPRDTFYPVTADTTLENITRFALPPPSSVW